ncbi:unnamed protein product [Orchesella dallaii]|uniref:F-box domain-containing protein n=1 Tax=Orchesella dallaii TaxID=48710 RepID=A0ABP1R6S6_9HEXA
MEGKTEINNEICKSEMEKKSGSSKFAGRCFRNIVDKMRKLKVGEFKFRTLSPLDNYIPPEIQEMIVKKIDDEKTLLQCRLVNWQWHQLANTLLEELQLARWTEFEPRHHDMPLCPTVRILDKNWKPGDSYFVGCPKAMLHCTGNPFPSNSLGIHGITLYWNIYGAHDKYHPVLGGRKCFKRRLEGLLIRFGHYLTSFTLFNLEVTVLDLESTLRHMPNLKALTMSYLRPSRTASVITQANRRRGRQNIISPHLTHVKLKYCECNECVNWLIQLVHQQLTSLEVYGCVGPYFRPRKFGKLKRLKVCDLENEEVNKMVLSEDETLSLEYLSIITVIVHIDELYGIVDFINRFPNTLTFLHLDIDESVRTRDPNLSDRLVDFMKIGDLYPALKRLEMSRMRGREWDENTLKGELEARFPNLETVQVQTYRDWAEDLKEVPVYDDCSIV